MARLIHRLPSAVRLVAHTLHGCEIYSHSTQVSLVTEGHMYVIHNSWLYSGDNNNLLVELIQYAIWPGLASPNTHTLEWEAGYRSITHSSLWSRLAAHSGTYTHTHTHTHIQQLLTTRTNSLRNTSMTELQHQPITRLLVSFRKKQLHKPDVAGDQPHSGYSGMIARKPQWGGGIMSEGMMSLLKLAHSQCCCTDNQLFSVPELKAHIIPVTKLT